MCEFVPCNDVFKYSSLKTKSKENYKTNQTKHYNYKNVVDSIYLTTCCERKLLRLGAILMH